MTRSRRWVPVTSDFANDEHELSPLTVLNRIWPRCTQAD